MTEEVVVPDAFGSTIFCDDIRFEVDGKVSIIGSYAGDMSVRGSFPAILPKFAAAVLFVQKKELFTKNLELRIFLPGDPEDKPSIVSDLSQGAPPAIDPSPDSKFIIIRANLVFSPFALNEPGSIKVRIVRDGVVHGAGSLRVVSAPPEETPSASPTA